MCNPTSKLNTYKGPDTNFDLNRKKFHHYGSPGGEWGVFHLKSLFFREFQPVPASNNKAIRFQNIPNLKLHLDLLER